MNISILTVFPELYTTFLSTSLIKRAQESGIVSVDIDAFFSFVSPKERIDAPTFGPGAGMLIRPDVVQKAVENKEKKYGSAYKIFFSPQGEKMSQPVLRRIAASLAQKKHLMLLPARYEGMDARVEEEYADEIISVGDFVLMGGDIPAMLFLEGLLRLIPGVVGKQESVQEESFTGPFVDYPEFTEPVHWKDKKVPDIVRSGNHAAIAQWRLQQAVQKSVKDHFNWVRSQPLTADQNMSVQKNIPPHYVALMHCDVLIGDEKKAGCTSVTSIDLHDISRSSSTYGVRNFFVVTPLLDQQKIVQKLVDFWCSDHGVKYNKNRHQAVQLLSIKNSLQETIDAITQKEGKKPLVIATSALISDEDNNRLISFYDQKKVWQNDRPVLLVFGTGRGLQQELIDQCDYQLLPIAGFSDFNHLSVRSAIAVVLDRWLGINLKYAKK